MLANDIVWVIFWLLFFHRVGTVRGWNSDRILLLYAMLTTAGGLALGVFSNCRRVGMLVGGGELDSVLALPVSPLLYLLVRRVETIFLGDVVFGLVLFATTGEPTPSRVALFVGGVVAATTLLIGFLVTMGSVSFFAGRGEAGELGLHSIVLLASYPVDIFGGATKALLHTAIPAAFVASAPSTLVDTPHPIDALALFSAALAFAVLGWATFSAGLRRYTSTGLWTHG
jgi:ABC-2 type transport system permease protein